MATPILPNKTSAEVLPIKDHLSPGIAENRKALYDTFYHAERAYGKGGKQIASGIIGDQTADSLGKFFPATYYVPNESEKNYRDALYSAKDIAEKEGARTIINLPVSDQLHKWQQEKDKAMLQVQFDAWVEQKFLNGSLADKELLKSTYPGYFQARVDAVNNKIELDRKIFNLKLFGAKTVEDLHLQFLLDQGLIPLDSAPIWDTTEYVTNATTRGRFPLMRGFLNSTTPHAREPVPPRSLKVGMFGQDGLLENTALARSNMMMRTDQNEGRTYNLGGTLSPGYRTVAPAGRGGGGGAGAIA